MKPTDQSSNNPHFVRTVDQFSDEEISAAIASGKADLLEVAVDPTVADSLEGWPYLIELMQIGPVYGRTGLEDAIHEIDDYIREVLPQRNLPFTRQSYQSVLEYLEGNVQTSNKLSFDRRISSLQALVRTMRSEYKTNQQKQKLREQYDA